MHLHLTMVILVLGRACYKPRLSGCFCPIGNLAKECYQTQCVWDPLQAFHSVFWLPPWISPQPWQHFARNLECPCHIEQLPSQIVCFAWMSRRRGSLMPFTNLSFKLNLWGEGGKKKLQKCCRKISLWKKTLVYLCCNWWKRSKEIGWNLKLKC